MTTARTQTHHVGRGGAARPRVTEPKPSGFVPVSADTFSAAADATVEVEVVEEFDPSTLDFDPADHNVEEVKAYVTEHPEQAEAISELERNGKSRSGLLSFIENYTADV